MHMCKISMDKSLQKVCVCRKFVKKSRDWKVSRYAVVVVGHSWVCTAKAASHTALIYLVNNSEIRQQS